MAVTAQCRAQAGRPRGRCLVEQPGQVGGLLPVRRLRDDRGRDRADSGERLQRALADPLRQLGRGQAGGHLGRAPERPHPVRRRVGSLQVKGDLPQHVRWVHLTATTRLRWRHYYLLKVGS
jgi:hypothetical protein